VFAIRSRDGLPASLLRALRQLAASGETVSAG